MKERILTRWSFQRWLYLLLGAVVIVQAIAEQQWIAAMLGGYFASMAVFNFGCAAGACYGDPCNTDIEKKANKEALKESIKE